MKKIFSLLIASLFFSCTQEKSISLTIQNSSSTSRKELAAISLSQLKGLDKSSFIVVDTTGKQVSYQITHDSLLLVPVDIMAESSVTYIVKGGQPDSFPTLVCGKEYPERLDDIAWENDRIAFRTYGPALKATGEKAYGYDVWVKRVSEPVVEMRYEKELNPETKAKIAELRKTNPKEASRLASESSYHVDHGDGLDFYKVGPTLGAGASGLVVNDSIKYPYCYNTYRILDNGPLRFTVELTFDPTQIEDNKNIVEKQIISLDAYSHLNKISISYENMTKSYPIVTGIVVHAPSNDYQVDINNGFIAYAEASDSKDGQIYVGAVFPNALKDAGMTVFSENEKKARGAEGHVLAFSEYKPGEKYIYYGGAGWSKWGFADSAAWYAYIDGFAANLKSPLIITVK